MKNFQQQLIILLPTLILAACGGKYEKNPVPDLDQMRQNAKLQQAQGPDAPRVIHDQGQTVVKEVPVTIGETKIDSNSIVIVPDPQMNFNEGQSSTFKIRVQVLVPGVTVRLTAKGLPDGAQLTDVSTPQDKGVYALTWNPALYTIPMNADPVMKLVSVHLVADVVGATDPKLADSLKGLTREQDISLLVFRAKGIPSDLKVDGLGAEVQEGQVTAFTVTATVPGVDAQTPQKPSIEKDYDNLSITAGNNFRELDGSNYIMRDVNKMDPEYLGNFKWKFYLTFDTKNVPVQPQLAKDGSVMAQADGTRVRFTLKVRSPYGVATPATLVQLKIKHIAPPAQPVQPTTPPVDPANKTPANTKSPANATPKKGSK